MRSSHFYSGGESSAPSPPFGKRGSQFAMDDIYDNKSDESLLMNSSRGLFGCDDV